MISHYKATVCNAVLHPAETITVVRYGRENLEEDTGTKKRKWKMEAKLEARTVPEHRAISEEIRLKKAKFNGHVISTHVDWNTRWVWRDGNQVGCWTQEVLSRDGTEAEPGKLERSKQYAGRKEYGKRIDKNQPKRTLKKKNTTEEDTAISEGERKVSSKKLKRFWEEKRKTQRMTELPMVQYHNERRIYSLIYYFLPFKIYIKYLLSMTIPHNKILIYASTYRTCPYCFTYT